MKLINPTKVFLRLDKTHVSMEMGRPLGKNTVLFSGSLQEFEHSLTSQKSINHLPMVIDLAGHPVFFSQSKPDPVVDLHAELPVPDQGHWFVTVGGSDDVSNILSLIYDQWQGGISISKMPLEKMMTFIEKHRGASQGVVLIQNLPEGLLCVGLNQGRVVFMYVDGRYLEADLHQRDHIPPMLQERWYKMGLPRAYQPIRIPSDLDVNIAEQSLRLDLKNQTLREKDQMRGKAHRRRNVFKLLAAALSGIVLACTCWNI
jgi:hypothetical protein